MTAVRYQYFMEGTHGLFRVGVSSTRSLIDPARWTGSEWVSSEAWTEDLMEGRMVPEDPADVVARFPGSI